LFSILSQLKKKESGLILSKGLVLYRFFLLKGCEAPYRNNGGFFFSLYLKEKTGAGGRFLVLFFSSLYARADRPYL
jgi:hypothetical protein